MHSTFKIPLYECTINLVVADDIVEAQEALYKKLKIDFEIGYCAGLTFSKGMNKYFVVFQASELNHNTISHEIYHLVRIISRDRQIEEEEAQAWLSGYLASKIYSLLAKKNYLSNG